MKKDDALGSSSVCADFLMYDTINAPTYLHTATELEILKVLFRDNRD